MLETNLILNGDAYKLIKEIDDHSIDLIYTDIPYLYDNFTKIGIKGTQHTHEEILKHKDQLIKGINYSILDEFTRVLKHIYIYMVFIKTN